MVASALQIFKIISAVCSNGLSSPHLSGQPQLLLWKVQGISLRTMDLNWIMAPKLWGRSDSNLSYVVEAHHCAKLSQAY